VTYTLQKCIYVNGLFRQLV